MTPPDGQRLVRAGNTPVEEPAAPVEPDEPFEALLEFLRSSRGFDFSGYKRASLRRRIDRRMQQVGIGDVGDYLDRLQLDPAEFVALFNTILINVTSFFRDQPAWDRLAADLLPAVLARVKPNDRVRVWSAGCASGQEAYTLAIVLAEALGVDQFRERVKVYATDVDEPALAEARHATYAERDVRACPPELVDRYFERSGSRYTFRGDLRRSVIFGRNDLVQNAPIGNIDLLACRNVLMYLTADTQAQVLQRLHFALNDTGLLMLGKAEMLLSNQLLFTPVDLRHRLFRRTPRPSGRERLVLPATGTVTHGGGDSDQLLRDEALRASVGAQLVLSADGRLAFGNARADALFQLSPRDLGRPFHDLEVSYRPVELRSLIAQAQAERRAVWARDVEWARGLDDPLVFDVEVLSLLDPSGRLLGTSLVFLDVTRFRQVREQLRLVHGQLETAYEELQSTNEELETTNEELQSTVEELETTNEELQSSNEELETMNAELQATSDEFQAVNEALRERKEEVEAVNRFTEAVLGGLGSAVVVVDRDLRVQVWTWQAEELWGLRPAETIGESLLTLDFGLPVERLRPLLSGALNDRSEEITVTAVDRRGRSVRVRVLGSPLRIDGLGPTGVILRLDALGQAGDGAPG
jgi:two-component system CheB/CheR fusion protein